MNQAKEILEKLRGQQHRLTNVRKSLVEVLCDSEIPLGAPELMDALKAHKINVNKTTVYREIEFLLEREIIREVDLLEGKKRYEILELGHHHHHVVCTKCKSIRCINMERDLDLIEKHIRAEYGFKVQSHTLEFFGLCRACYDDSDRHSVSRRARSTTSCAEHHQKK